MTDEVAPDGVGCSCCKSGYHHRRETTIDDIRQYVATLDSEIKKLFVAARSIVLEAADTLTDDFQIAADIVTLFEKRAEIWFYRRQPWAE